jgi:hypothetical protein
VENGYETASVLLFCNFMKKMIFEMSGLQLMLIRLTCYNNADVNTYIL